MIKERSAGIIVFRRENPIKFLLLHYSEKHWDFPKGHLEKDETDLQAALRETKEETGITDLHLVPGFEKEISYFFRSKEDLINKEVLFYLAETKTEHVKLSNEHIGYAWLSFEKALERLTFKTAKDILDKAHAFLESGK